MCLLIEMESFIALRKHLAMCGIVLHRPPKTHPFNAKNSMVIIVGSTSIYLYGSLLRETSTFEEYTDAIYNTASACFCTVVFSTVTCKISDLFRFIDNLEKTISSSKLSVRSS